MQTGQTGQAKTSCYALWPVRPVPQTGKTGQGQRTANHFYNAPLGPSSQDLIIQEVLSYFSEVFSQDPHFGDLWAFFTKSNNQYCIHLDSTAYLYSRLNINHNLFTWASNHFSLAIHSLCQPWDFNIAFFFLEQIHTWASDLGIPSLRKICPWIQVTP